MQVTPHQARYYAEEITCRGAWIEGISPTLFDAKVDFNPHQIEAALFALNKPLQQSVLLADEVGLGKTIEAGLVLCQLWAEQKRNLIIVCPAVLCKQWENELYDKFALPSLVVDRQIIKASGLKPAAFFQKQIGKKVLILSHHFVAKCESVLVAQNWHRVVVDEAHKFRNAHRKSNLMGQNLRRIFQGQPKLLLTATPLQNSLMELYGLSTLLDDYLFGDEKQFRKQFVHQGDLDALRQRLKGYVKRTLRKQVLEYVHYTERKTFTQSFMPNDREHALYEAISTYLQKETVYALPKRSRHLMVLILRKLLASSPQAILDTLKKVRLRLQKMVENEPLTLQLDWDFDEESGIEEDWREEQEGELESDDEPMRQELLQAEIAEIDGLILQAEQLQQDSKAIALLDALKIGFSEMAKLGAKQKVIIFTESVRTQDYLVQFLSQNGYADKIVAFSGTNKSAQAAEIYTRWKTENAGSERITGSADVDKRTALIDYFRNEAQIMIATEAAAEGVNLQFCSLLINYDLPWNPQRVEQRIGRCHRYGQEFDVVVINFLNQRNEVDRRVLELLQQKFHLFDGVFGASDQVLGKIESGVDIEKQILAIYQNCRTPLEIQQAFDELQQRLDEEIKNKLKETEENLFANFDQDVLAKLKIESEKRLNQLQKWVWKMATFALQDRAHFDESNFSFQLTNTPSAEIANGQYYLRKTGQGTRFRLNHPLGEWCLSQSSQADTPVAQLQFHYQPESDGKIALIEQNLGKSGWLRIDKMVAENENQAQEKLIFTACTDNGEWLDADFCRKLLNLNATMDKTSKIAPMMLAQTAEIRLNSEINALFEANTQLLDNEIERLNQWAEDQRNALSSEIEHLNNEIEQVKRQSRQAQTLQEKQELQQKQRELENTLRRKRRDLFDKDDEIIENRDRLIDKITQQLAQNVSQMNLFVARWGL